MPRRCDFAPVIIIGPNASLRVRGGALNIEHGPVADRRTLRIDIDAEPKPHTILFDSHGEFLTGEAIRWCARYAINIVLPNGPGRVILFVESALETADAGEGCAGAHARRIRDTSPSLIRAQASANPIEIARKIVWAKIDASAAHVPAVAARAETFEKRVDAARTISDIMTIEARVAAVYWRAFWDLGLREARGGNLPRSWLRFVNRQKGASFLGSRHASHPINAMLNYAYVVEAGRLARVLTALGLALQIGFLHSDRKGRNSLVRDAIEPLRPAIDARVFAFIAAREFCRADFPEAGRNTHRLDRAIVTALLRDASLPWSDIDRAARWIAETISTSAFRVNHLRHLHHRDPLP